MGDLTTYPKTRYSTTSPLFLMGLQLSRNLSPGDSDVPDRVSTAVYELAMTKNKHTNNYLESVSFSLTKPVDRIHTNSLVIKGKKTKKNKPKTKKHKMLKKKHKKIKKRYKRIK